MVERMETVIIGGGQAGLSLSYQLMQAGREHIVLEKSAMVADAWRKNRWDSFTLVTPNWTFKLPGGEYDGSDPNGFMLKDEILHRFKQYEQKNHLPVSYSTEVTRVEPIDDHYRYRVITDNKVYETKNVVIATGQFQKVKIPAFANGLPPEILQIPSNEYRNPQALPAGAILVIGSAQSGCQIAEELHEAGRKVYLSTGSAGRVPRRYRGLDGFDWLSRTGFFDRTPAMLSSPHERFFAPPHVSGKGGGRTLNLHQFSREGIILLGHANGFEDGKLLFAPDLKENLAKADAFAANAIRMVDAYVLKTGMDVPTEEVIILDDGFRAPVITTVDPGAEGISAIIWATGYSYNYNLIRLPVLDEYNYPSADRGVTRHPGLYFIGIAWMNKLKSGFLMGIGESSQYLAEVICKE